MLKLIIIDDEPKAIIDLKRVVENICENSLIHTFDETATALSYLAENPADIAFLDINMPDMSGLELAKRIKTISPSTNIIFVTAYAEYALDAMGLYPSGYLMKPVSKARLQEALENLRHPLPQSTSRIRVQTFGNFEVFVDNVPVSFGRSKSKELLAYLVDRKGASATTRECFAVLFQDKEYDLRQERYFQSIVYDMIASLKKAKAQDMIIKKRNSFCVNPEAFYCDYYRFLQKDVSVINTYMGEYMAQYSWAEFTAGLLQMTKK